MRVLLLQPEDSLHSGPWSAQPWDVVVDLGRSPLSPSNQHQNHRILRLDSYRDGLADARMVRNVLHTGNGNLFDDEGIDWWELTSVAIVQQALTVIQLQRIAAEIHGTTELWTTRPDWSANVLADLLHTPLRSFHGGTWKQAISAARHYFQVLHHFSPVQIKQIFFDKYDAGYRFRSHFAAKQNGCSAPVVLVPSAYANVSRMAASYAEMLPSLHFLFVATRHSAHEFRAPENVEVRDLAAYARVLPHAEASSLLERWAKLKSHLQHSCEALRLLSAAGELDQFSGFFQSGPFVRDAWRQVLQREPVCSVLCGDDSNFYTRLPVLLAAKRKIPTIDFHHGALDGLYLFKELPSDLYLAKSEMERDYLLRLCGLPETKVVIAPPLVPQRASSNSTHPGSRCIVLFSEPYESGGMRAEDVYRELLPPLWSLARHYDRDLVIKLHPFESRAQRIRVLRRVLPPDAIAHVQWVQGPLTPELLRRAWFGVTIESTTAIDCTENGVCCFLCRWLRLSPYGYADQFVRFGMGEPLDNPGQISAVPARLKEFYSRRRAQGTQPVEPPRLLQWLSSGYRETVPERSAS